ncbi:MAG: DotH/IcmK family type IV secretion protein [Alphaproteobacteria bacterium]|nr:DotH/IcmK family type IV secretion protein [Alphaproteobacteria bacterium]MDP7221660.1 DotH/IcmK family type IV secretion protein [Alphaproteobacteria bacterium]
MRHMQINLCKFFQLTAVFAALSALPAYAQSPSDFFQALQAASQTDGGAAAAGNLNSDNQPVASGGTANLPSSSSPFSQAMGGNNQAAAGGNPGFNLPVGQQGAAMQGGVTREQVENRLREEAFNAAVNGLLPMKPDEIRRLLALFDKTKQAVETPIFPYPTPEVVVTTIPMDPGAKPPLVKVATGHVATVNVLDVTGKPWPIQDITWAGNFEIVQPEEGGHVVRITPLSEFAYGNMSIRLVELDTPIVMTIRTTRDVVHYRFDARIPEYGPYAEAPLIDGGLKIAAGDGVLGSILDGIPPDTAERLIVEGVDGRTSAYKVNATTYLRTPLTLLSPGWSGSVSSADGMKVYELSNAPVVLLSDGGAVVRARIGEDEELGAE